MNTNLRKILIRMSKLCIYGIVVLLSIFTLAFSMDSNAQNKSVEDIDVEIPFVNEVSLDHLFSYLEETLSFKFSHLEQELDPSSYTVLLDYNQYLFGDLLREVSAKTELSFKRVNDNIFVRLKEFGSDALTESINLEAFIEGTVTDDTGEPLPGATIRVEGTDIGTITDIEGNFKLTVPDGLFTIVVSFIGFENKTVDISKIANDKLIIELSADIETLEDVVVIGYGTQSKAKVTGSIGEVDIDELNKIQATNFDQALVGKVPGVTVTQTTGQPGSDLNILIRGTGTLNSDNQPLYVVDGIPISSSGQVSEFVNMEDIASIQILKDAASAAIYGSRGSNGVVLITTKTGEYGEKMNINFSHSSSLQRISKRIDMMNAYQYAELSKDGHDAAYLQEVPTGNADDPNSVRPIGYHKIPEELIPYLNGEAGLTDTDWQDQIFRDALMQRYSLSISGGTNGLTYYVAANHTNQEGIIINSDYKRTGIRSNIEINRNKLIVGVNLSTSITSENRVNANGPYFDDGIVASALKMSPTWAVYNADGSYNFEGNGAWRIGTDYQHNEILNPVAIANQIGNTLDNRNILSNMYLEYEIIEGLSFRSSFGYNYNSYSNEYFRPSDLPFRGRNFYLNNSDPSARFSDTDISKWIAQNTLTYDVTFKKHHITALAGITAEKSTTSTKRIANQLAAGINTGINPFLLINTPSQLLSSNNEFSQWSLYSLFSRVQYDYDDKYLLSVAMRGDASSRFGANNRWGYFPSASVGWRVSQEEFLNNVDWVSELKLKASLGLTGNNGIGNYEQFSQIEPDYYVLGNPAALQNGTKPQGVANPDLRWETTRMLNIGINGDFFDGKIGFTTEYYDSEISDILLNVPVPQTTGFGSARQNIGRVSNRGFETSIYTNQSIGELNISANANYAVNQNEVLALGPENADIITTNGTGHAYFITRVGEPVGSYFLLVQDGIFESEDELESYPHTSSTQPGDFKFVDVDGDGVIERDDDRAIVGNYVPDFTYAFGTSLAYKGFELSVTFQGVHGNEILNLSRRYIANGEGNFNNTTELLNRYRSEEDPGNGNVNRANRKSQGDNGRTSTWHVEDGSYLRLQNAYLGYNLPGSLLNKMNINTAKVYLSVTNLVTWTNYSGYNPEVSQNSQGSLARGLDYGNYPLPKTFTIGINLSF